MGMPPLLKGQRGAVAIEFALVLIFILLPLLIGIIEFGILFYNKAMITNASREGARTGIVSAINPDDPDDDTYHPDDSAITGKVDQYLQTFLITFGGSNSPGTDIKRYLRGTDPPTEIAYGAETAGDYLRVEVTYTYDFLVLPRFVSEFLETFQLTVVTIMRFE